MENIRAYNQMFSMTSFGARVDDSINKGTGPYVFRISGQIYDTDNEIDNRMFHFGGEKKKLSQKGNRRRVD